MDGDSGAKAGQLSAPEQERAHTMAALRVKLSGYEWTSCAVLLQIPQVAPRLVDAQVAAHRGYFCYPPAGLFYLSATFQALGVETVLCDLNYEMLHGVRNGGQAPADAWQQALTQILQPFEAPLVCISYMFDSTFEQLEAVAQEVRRLSPRACIAVGGVAATAVPDQLLQRGLADFVFLNEGELTLQRFYAFVRGAPDAQPVNVCFMNESGHFCQLPAETGGAVELDIRAELSKLPVERYHLAGSLNNFSRMRGLEVPFATVLSRRGCRAHCTFCSVRNFNGRSVRVRQVEGVIEELRYWRDQRGIRHFDWLDDDLLYDKEEALRLFHQMAEQLPDITWSANNGLIAAAITPELMDAMQRSGCIGFTVGLETGNKEMLRKVRKPGSIEKFRAFTHVAKRYPKLFLLVNFILGLPGETFEQMLDSFRLAHWAKLDWNNFFTFQPLRNTDAFIAYAGLEQADTDLKRMGSTINFNPVRGGVLGTISDKVATGYEIFELPEKLIPSQEQRKEIWFTFNYLVNFLRMPALTTEEPQRVENAIRWLSALREAYAENGAIDCVLYYLLWRAGYPRAQAEQMRSSAAEKIKTHAYWNARDQVFAFSAFLERALPPLDARVQRLALSSLHTPGPDTAPSPSFDA